jgi:uncharacterized protein (DUF2252 family)
MPDFDQRKRAYAYGRKCRDRAPRTEQGRWKPAKDRDPLAVLREVIRGRLPELLPIRVERMSASPFGFFRGAAAVMAADLAALPRSGILTQICGDAHVLNLGSYAAPDGRIVFDINDFDETIAAPWEWDLKRLATSLVLARRETGNGKPDCTQAVAAFACSYRSSIHNLCKLSVLELARYQVHRHLQASPVQNVLLQAQRATPQENLQRLALQSDGGRWHFHSRPPLLFPVKGKEKQRALASLAGYRETLAPERQHVFDNYRPADVGFKVVGTGSVGVRDYVILLFGRDAGDPLFLQIKEEPPSCYTRCLRPPRKVEHQGQRVVYGQRLMQAQSDILLGWTSIQGRDYLVRQLADHKATIDVKTLHGEALLQYAELCGEVLAKGHAHSANPCMIAGYLGSSPRFDHALAKFALAYADQTEKDFKRFVAAHAKTKK